MGFDFGDEGGERGVGRSDGEVFVVGFQGEVEGMKVLRFELKCLLE